MMSMMQALILGFVQGLTEFLPVSSSGHMALIQSMFDNFEEPGLFYGTLLHLATMLVILIYFRDRLTKLIQAFFGLFSKKYAKQYYEQKHFLWGLVVATIPTAVIGLLLKDYAEGLFNNPIIIGYCMILTSVMLIVSDSFKPKGKVTPLRGLLVGIAQGLAVFPGISRSGTTMFVAMGVGVSRKEVVEFSFILSLPAILGATILQYKEFAYMSIDSVHIYLAGMAVAFVVGMVTVRFIEKIVMSANMKYIALYCLLVGIFAILWL